MEAAQNLGEVNGTEDLLCAHGVGRAQHLDASSLFASSERLCWLETRGYLWTVVALAQVRGEVPIRADAAPCPFVATRLLSESA